MRTERTFPRWPLRKLYVCPLLNFLLVVSLACAELSVLVAGKYVWAETPNRLTAHSEAKSEQKSSDEFEGKIEATQKESVGDAPVIVTQVRTANHRLFDRIVFSFAGEKFPGYRVEYTVDPIQECGSGETVQPIGSARLLIRFSPSQAHMKDGQATIKRLDRVSYQTLKQFKVICDYEAELELALDLSDRVPYRVMELTKPLRIVIDLKNLSHK